MAGYGVLSQIPGLAGYVAGDEERRAQIAHQQAVQGSQINQAGAIQGMLSRQQAMQEQQEMKGILSRVAQQSGGDRVKMGQALIQSGNPALMKLGNDLIPRDNYATAGDGILNRATGDVVPNPYAKERDPKAPPSRTRPVQVGNTYFEVKEEMKPDGSWTELGRRPLRDPTIVMPKNPLQPLATDQGYFDRAPNGGLTPVMNPNNPGQQLRPPSLVSGGNQQALALRREFNANPEVKLANSLEPKVGPIAQYVAEVGKGMGNSVGDAELVKLWLMTTHPKGDQISNLDYRSIEKMPDLYGRIKNVAGNFVFGKTLDADTRASMWNSISEKYKATDASRNKYRSDVSSRAKKMGIDEALIFSPQQE
jgi:hypothetical protein